MLDDSPTLEIEGHQADVLAGSSVLASVDLEFVNGYHAWNWPVPEVTSASCRLRVTVRDLFGNQSSIEEGDFRILLPGTDAPPSARAPGWRRPRRTPSTRRPTWRSSSGRPASPACGPRRRGPAGPHAAGAPLPAGRHARAWDGRDDAGRRVSGGAYLVRLTVDGRDAPARKVVLLP
ncbi:MAG: hypothetical protein IPH09_11075 [bacterium]|nr:hypothetical protein [bacterium]